MISHLIIFGHAVWSAITLGCRFGCDSTMTVSASLLNYEVHGIKLLDLLDNSATGWQSRAVLLLSYVIA